MINTTVSEGVFCGGGVAGVPGPPLNHQHGLYEDGYQALVVGDTWPGRPDQG